MSPTPTALPTPYAGPFRNNGGDYTSLRTDTITVDGSLADWAGVPAIPVTALQSGAENLTGQSDLAVNARMAWDDARLYVVYEVADDLHVQPLAGFNLFNGDSTELFIDTDLAGDFPAASQNGDDFEFETFEFRLHLPELRTRLHFGPCPPSILEVTDSMPAERLSYLIRKPEYPHYDAV